MINRWHTRLIVVMLLASVSVVSADNPEDGISRGGAEARDVINRFSDSIFRFNIRTRTLGGKQFWTDYLVRHDWRIQRNEVTNHYRLLDDRNYRHHWGTFSQCRKALGYLVKREKLPEVTGTVVLLLHGLGRTRSSMDELQEYLQKQSGSTVISLSYASTRASLDQHARALQSVLKNIPHAKQVQLVGHSLGNLVIRRYLKSADKTDARIHRIVMLAPPNQGSSLATLFKDNHLFQIFWGESGEELADDWQGLMQQLATPACEFGIIAGGNLKSPFDNPLIKGNDDLVLRVAETRLAGARDFTVVQSYHGRLMKDPQAMSCTLRFLRHGHFISDEKRQPISDGGAGS